MTGTSTEIDRALQRIRAEHLFWPAPRAAAQRCRILAVGAKAQARARQHWPDAAILYQPQADLPGVDPDDLEIVYAEGPIMSWAVLGGVGGAADASALLGRTRTRSPWTGETLTLDDALEAQALLRRAAMRARGGARLIGMSRWKRRGLTPFLDGPDGAASASRGAVPVLWGAGAGPPTALRVEDGFLRSVGLGLRHVHPLSLVIAAGRLHFDGSGPTSFDACVASADFTPALLGRARALRQQIVALRLSKYNLGSRASLPDTSGREAVLVPGQVANDASIRLGAQAVRDDGALLAAVRARFPPAFLLYKPHPDTLSGLRDGRLAQQAALDLADAVVEGADIADCLDWADRVATITSLTGFEALLRGKAVTVFGRPFYAGWGLTDDVDPPARSTRLTLDALSAAALLLYASYIDPVTRLPAPPEVAIARLAAARDAAGRPGHRLAMLWRLGISWLLNWRPPGLRR
jgi:capsular polysaccharide export protein